MFDLDNLSYRAYGNLVVVVLLVIALLLNLFPFSLVELVMCIIQIPLYLFIRSHLDEPLHARGLNLCFVLTILFYILLFVAIKCISFLAGEAFAIFFGYKKHDDSKYQRLIDYIRFNGIDPKLLEAEERLKQFEMQTYLLYKRKFRENKTFREINEEFDIDNPRIVETLDKAYFYMIGALGI